MGGLGEFSGMDDLGLSSSMDCLDRSSATGVFCLSSRFRGLSGSRALMVSVREWIGVFSGSNFMVVSVDPVAWFVLVGLAT